MTRSISSGESTRRGVRAERSAIPAKGDCGLSVSPMARSYSETQTTDFANWRGRYWCPCREQRPTVSGGAPHPNAAHQTSHLSLARAIGKPKINIYSVIVFAWIFDFYAHASDKWDASENQSGAGHRCKSRPNFRELRSSSRAPRLPNIFDRSADMLVVLMIPADPSRKQSCEKCARDIQGRHPDVSSQGRS